MKFDTREATERWARAFARQLARPRVICLSGDLGAGKTQITRWCLDELAVTEVSSPTFAIHHRYEPSGIDHVDLYRLGSARELEDTGFWDLFAANDGLVFVEWADRVPRAEWPLDWTRVFVNVSLADGEARVIDITTLAPGQRA